MEEEKKLGLGNVISVSMGLVLATSCLVSLGQGSGEIGASFIISMVIACVLNMFTMLSLAELNALMPDITGGLAQYTLAAMGPFPTIIVMVGSTMVISIVSSGAEAAIFAYAIGQVVPFNIPNIVWAIGVSVILMILNLKGLDVFAKIQDFVAYLMVAVMLTMGLIGVLRLGTGTVVEQELVISGDASSVIGMSAMAFWLFIGGEMVIPIARDVKNAKRNVPLGMILGLGIILIVQSVLILGFHNYVSWADLLSSPAPHMLYGAALLGKPGEWIMVIVASLALISTQNSILHGGSEVFRGMSKMNLLPHAFAKQNKNGAPAFGIVFLTIGIIIFALLSQNSADAIDFFILVCSIFGMMSYLFSHIGVLVFRRKLPKAYRSFRVPTAIPVIGCIGLIYMTFNISPDPAEKLRILICAGGLFTVYAVYASLWIKFKWKTKIFRSVPIEEVMAMEDDRYYQVRIVRGIWR